MRSAAPARPVETSSASSGRVQAPIMAAATSQVSTGAAWRKAGPMTSPRNGPPAVETSTSNIVLTPPQTRPTRIAIARSAA